MNRFPIIGRLAVIVSGLAGALLALCANAAPAAFAAVVTPWGGDPRGHGGLATVRPKPPGWNKHAPLPEHAQALATGDMPGWQITLIAAAAALLAAALAVVVYRLRATRRRVTVSAA
jgi:hypothetical protein